MWWWKMLTFSQYPIYHICFQLQTYIPCNSLKTRCVSKLREEQGQDVKESETSLSHEGCFVGDQISFWWGGSTNQTEQPIQKAGFCPREHVQVVVACREQHSPFHWNTFRHRNIHGLPTLRITFNYLILNYESSCCALVIPFFLPFWVWVPKSSWVRRKNVFH